MTIRNRLERLERETRFKDWLRFQRYIESLNDQQLEAFIVLGYCPEPAPPEPRKGMSSLDLLSQKELLKMFEADERRRTRFAHCSDQDKEFFITHNHWPEDSCDESDCCKAWSDQLRRKYSEAEA